MGKQWKVTSPLLVALGGNVSLAGESLEQTLAKALIALVKTGFAIRAVSRFYRTPCFPEGAGPDYVNAAVMLESSLSSEDALVQLHRVEAEFGRERVQRWGQRTLDLDLIAHGDAVLPSVADFNEWRALDPDLQAKAAPDRLILPHPRLQDRAFVLVPLADIAAAWRHPVLGQTVHQLLQQLPAQEIAEVSAL